MGADGYATYLLLLLCQGDIVNARMVRLRRRENQNRLLLSL